MLTIEIKGLDKCMQELKASYKREREKVVTPIIEKVVENIKAATPVRTGRARDGWHIENGNIVNHVPYIDDLNEGSSHKAPEFFVEKAALNTDYVEPNGQIVVYK